jgi:hypothetical protein
VERAAAAAKERNDRTLTALNDDPLNALTPAERADAASRDGFVSKDCPRLPLVALRDRVAAVMQAGRKAEAFVYARALAARLGDLAQEAQRRGDASGRMPWLAADEQQALAQLHQFLPRLREQVQGSDDKEVRDAALRKAQAALALQGRITEARAAVGTRPAAPDTGYARQLWRGR